VIEGLSHITLITHDLDRMEELLVKLLDARRVYDSGDQTFSLSRERFFLVQNIWIAIMEGEPVTRSYNHIAFKIAAADYDSYLARVKELGLELLPSRSRIAGEGRSIYVYDHDGHLFELHTGTLEERLARYRQDA
jgi:fosfomycin resistance protein FosX